MKWKIVVTNSSLDTPKYRQNVESYLGPIMNWLCDRFEHIHYSDIDTDNVVVNQLAHEYLDEDREPGSYNNIVVDPEAYEKLRIKR